jgi:hypothetical protein
VSSLGELEITPEPSPEERVAIEKAVSEVLAEEPKRPGGAWWRAGVDAADEDEPDPR